VSTTEGKTGHEKIVSLIARARFPYPDEKHPQWKTYVNSPDLTMGIDTTPEPVYPDILVIDDVKREAVMIGEVETETTVSEERAKDWEKYATLAPTFYIYVPEDRKDAALGLLGSKGIRYTGLRGYSYGKDGKLALSKV